MQPLSVALLYETNRPEFGFSEQCRSLLVQVAREVLPPDVRGNGVHLRRPDGEVHLASGERMPGP